MLHGARMPFYVASLYSVAVSGTRYDFRPKSTQSSTEWWAGCSYFSAQCDSICIDNREDLDIIIVKDLSHILLISYTL